MPPPAGITRQPRPHSEPQDPLCPGPGQGSPLPLGGASGAQDPFTQPHAHPPILPGSSGHVSTNPSPSALLWAFPSPSCSPGEAGLPCGSVKGGVFPPPSLSFWPAQQGHPALTTAPCPSPEPPTPEGRALLTARHGVPAGFLPTILLANTLPLESSPVVSPRAAGSSFPLAHVRQRPSDPHAGSQALDSPQSPRPVLPPWPATPWALVPRCPPSRTLAPLALWNRTTHGPTQPWCNTVPAPNKARPQSAA